MKIVIDLTSLADNFTGIERFAFNIAEKMIEDDEENQYVLIFKEKVYERIKRLTAKSNVECMILPRKNKLWFSQVTLYRALKGIEADYFLFLAFPAPFFLHKRGIINTIHDLGCWDCPWSMPFKMVLYFRVLYWNARKKSRYILTVSKFSEKRIEEVLGVNGNRILVIYNGVDDSLKRNRTVNNISVRLKKYGIPDDKPYILSLATLEPRKNVELLLKAYNGLIADGVNMPILVMAGRTGWKIQKVIRDFLSPESGKQVIFTGYIEEEDLPAVYSSARCFVFPSKYEGFGLPPLEALYMGAEVLLSDIAPFKELFDGYVSFFKANAERDLKEALYRECFVKEERISFSVEIYKKYNYKEEAEKLKAFLLLGMENVKI